MELPDRILVVDDQARVRDLMETTLRAQGYLVETAADGREALAMLTDETFALIVADLVMPDVNGLELLTEVKKLAPMAEVILVTAHGSLESATEALRQGAHDYIIKPFDLKGFEHSVQRALTYRRLKLEKLSFIDLAHHQEEILRSHRTLQALFDGITDGLYILDRDMRIVAINQAEAKRLGTKPEALLDPPCDITFWGDAIETVTQIVLNTFETGEEGNWESQQDTARRGPFVDRDLRTYPIFRPSGEVDQVILFAQDVAEKRQLQASLFRSANLAAVGQLASSIAHQINNPLTVVIANTQLMQMDTEPTSPDYEMIKDVMDAAARISRIVQNLLDFSNQASYAWVETDLEANIDDALNFVAHSLRKGNIRVVKDTANLPPIIASANHLKLLWLNLLLNAQDAITARENTLDEKGTIEVHATQVDSSYVQVQIIDNGVGIPLQHHQLLFHPFFTTKPPGKGLGLGLYTCRIITEHHQGQIEIDSGDGNPGTIVTVTLPIRAAHPSGEAALGYHSLAL